MPSVDLETELYQLERRMLLIVKSRDEVILEANRLIREANREFDELAVPLGKQINELRERLKLSSEPVDTSSRRPARSHKPPAMDGLDDDDQEHYRQLLAKRKAKR